MEKFSDYLKEYFHVFEGEPMVEPGKACAWVGHIAFARWLVDCLRPRVFVELGVHCGVSYGAFCQAVRSLSPNTRCFGIDTWQGDDHAGHYGGEILATLREFHDPRFSSFSRLIPSTFDDALFHFADGSVDLLHIDGFHTYEAVKHDFETWRPKLSARAAVLFHDINVRENQFGVWRFWEEVSRKWPHFTFHHSHGLGVLGYGAELPEAIMPLLQAKEQEQAMARIFFTSLSQPYMEKALLAIHLASSEGNRKEADEVREEEKAKARDLAEAVKRQELEISRLNEVIVRETVTRVALERLGFFGSGSDEAGKDFFISPAELQSGLKAIREGQAEHKSLLEKVESAQSSQQEALNSVLEGRAENRSALEHLMTGQSSAQNILSKMMQSLEQLHDLHHFNIPAPSTFEGFVARLMPAPVRKAIKRKRLTEDIVYLRNSRRFDAAWYLAKYPDVAQAGIDAAAHYVLHGEEEGRQPILRFKADRQRVVRYRRLALSGCYFAQYLRAAGEHPGYPDGSATEEPSSPFSRRGSEPIDLKEFFQGNKTIKSGAPSAIKALFIGHEASLTGAPVAFLELVRQISIDFPVDCLVALQSGGPLVPDMRELAPVLVLPDLNARTGSFEESAKLLGTFFAQQPGPKVVMANTAAADNIFCKIFSEKNIPYISWIHEMPDCMERHFGGGKKLEFLAKHSSSLIFASDLSQKENSRRFKFKQDKVKLIKNGVRLRPDDLGREEIRKRIRLELKIPEDALLVLGCGTVEDRKGTDLFVQVARQYLAGSAPRERGNTHFLWVGAFPFREYYQRLQVEVEKAGLENRVHFIGERKDAHLYFKASDAFLMTSRSETLGLVAVEAIGYKLPVIGFADATGASEYIEQGFGGIVPHLDTDAMTEELGKFLSGERAIRPDGDTFVEAELSVRRFAEQFYEEFKNAVAAERESTQTVLVISGSFPPVNGNRVEGGGLRTWGLARSIKKLLPNHEVTLASYHRAENKIADGYHEGVYVTEWQPDNLKRLLSRFSTVIVSYCMGELSTMVTGSLTPGQQLILDCYVPIYVEICARKSTFVQREYESLMIDVPRFNQSLKRGDFFLCANPAQYDFYRGVLAAVGRINPKTYGDVGLRIVPYGIDSTEPVAKEQPIRKLLGACQANCWRILWFGAVYPWFNMEILLEAIELLNRRHESRLIMVGHKNPFNHHPDFVAKAEEVDSLLATRFKDVVHTHDWVPYEDRADWYLDCDLIITLNEPGMENGLSWRTRVADYVWAGMPIATNGGDPLGEDLIAHGAAGRLDIGSAERLMESIHEIIADESRLQGMKARMLDYRPRLQWDNVIKPLGEIIAGHRLAADRF